MHQENLPYKIAQFWDWFASNEQMFREIADAEAAKDAMDNQVLEFGLFSWQIEEGGAKPFSLTISPNGDRKRLVISRQIMEAAPISQYWEFHYCKPPGNWDYTFEMYDRFMLRQKYNASDWEYVLFNNPGNNIEVVIRADNLHGLGLDERLDAGELALTNILGEELVIDYLCALEVVNEFGPKHNPPGKKMHHLKSDFEAAVCFK